jgi:hypothetical protein
MKADLIKRLEETKDRFMNGDLGRREFLKILRYGRDFGRAGKLAGWTAGTFGPGRQKFHSV